MNALENGNLNTQQTYQSESESGSPHNQVEQSLTPEENTGKLYVSNERERERYLKLAQNSLKAIKSWRSSVAEWKLEKGQNPVEGCVKSRQFLDHGQIFLLQATLNIHPSIIFDDLAYNTKEQLDWNKFVSTYKILEKIEDNYDVVYCIVPGRLCGLVQARDFVFVRHYTKEHGEYMHSACSVTHANMPEQTSMVRGENGPSGWILETVPGETDKCNFFWFVNTNVKVPLPKYILKIALSSKLLDYLKLLRQRIDTLNQRLLACNST